MLKNEPKVTFLLIVFRLMLQAHSRSSTIADNRRGGVV